MKNEYRGLFHKISRIRKKGNDLILSELNKLGIEKVSPSHGHILTNLYQKDGMTMKEIAEKIRKKKNTVTILVDKLIKAGYIYKETAPEDKRITHIYLTEKGNAFRDDFYRIGKQLIEKTYQGFSEDEKELLISLLNRVDDNL